MSKKKDILDMTDIFKEVGITELNTISAGSGPMDDELECVTGYFQ